MDEKSPVRPCGLAGTGPDYTHPPGSRAKVCRTGPHGEGDEPKPMMNEREKSDPAVVATKSTNEAGQPGEERMEPRAGTKGNAA